MSSLPDHIYLDLSVINNDNTGEKIKTNLSFTELRNNPFLDNPDNYYLGICRFEIDTPGFSLPQFIPIILLDGENIDPNKTIYTITMGHNVTTGGITKLTDGVSVNVMWSPEDQSAKLPKNQTIPSGALVTQDIETGYYNCYSLKWWINCVNKALLDCWLLLFPLDTNPTASAPYLTIDPLTNLVSLYTVHSFNSAIVTFSALMNDSSGFLNDNLPSNKTNTYPAFLNSQLSAAMFFNEPLYNLFSAFPSIYYGIDSYIFAPEIFDAQTLALYNSRPYLFNYYIQPVNYNGINIVRIYDNGEDIIDFCKTDSNYSPVPMWNPVSQIIFSSALLPISVSLTNVPSVYNSNKYDYNYIGGNGNANVNSMLTDIEVGLTTGSEYKPSVLYVPKNEYRLVDLFGNHPINQASFTISWKTKYGQVIAFKLGSQSGANIKLLFRRKRFNLNNLPPYDSN
jgi:hypothetical protein